MLEKMTNYVLKIINSTSKRTITHEWYCFSKCKLVFVLLDNICLIRFWNLAFFYFNFTSSKVLQFLCLLFWCTVWYGTSVHTLFFIVWWKCRANFNKLDLAQHVVFQAFLEITAFFQVWIVKYWWINRPTKNSRRKNAAFIGVNVAV